MTDLNDSENNFDEDPLVEDDQSAFVSLKKFSPKLAAKYSFLNQDMNLFGSFQVVELIRGELRLNLNATADSVEKLLQVYKEKLNMLDNSDDKVRCTENEIFRLKKLLTRKSQEFETASSECARVKDTLHDERAELKLLRKQLNTEKNNMKILISNVTRERNQFKNDKTKIEREMVLLKERMNKLLSDPKKSYSSIEINQPESLPSSAKFGSKKALSEEKCENQINEEVSGNCRIQLEEVVLENRQLREQLVNMLVQLKQLSKNHKNESVNKLEKQRNNNGSSRNSSSSDISIKSNETFIVSHPVSEVDERVYLEMPFNVIKEDLLTLFNDCLGSLSNTLKAGYRTENRTDSSTFDICTGVELIDSAPMENISRLQKEIFQMRRQLIDYETIIQGKDSLLEVAIEQRIRRGSLLPSNSSSSMEGSDIFS